MEAADVHISTTSSTNRTAAVYNRMHARFDANYWRRQHSSTKTIHITVISQTHTKMSTSNESLNTNVVVISFFLFLFFFDLSLSSFPPPFQCFSIDWIYFGGDTFPNDIYQFVCFCMPWKHVQICAIICKIDTIDGENNFDCVRYGRPLDQLHTKEMAIFGRDLQS